MNNAGAAISDEKIRLLYRFALQSLAFDPEWHAREYPECAQARLHPFEYFYREGWRQGQSGSKYFQPLWYKEHYLGANPEENPVEHYLFTGAHVGLMGHPQAGEDTFIKGWAAELFARYKVPSARFSAWPWQGAAQGEPDPQGVHIFFTLHEATRTGALLSALHAMQELAKRPGVTLWSFLVLDGPLRGEFAAVSRLLTTEALIGSSGSLHFGLMRLVRDFAAMPAAKKLVIGNTVTVPQYLAGICRCEGVDYVPWVHELPDVIEFFRAGRHFVELSEKSRLIFTPARHTAEALGRYAVKNGAQEPLAPFVVTGSAIRPAPARLDLKQYYALKASMEIAPASPLVLGCGNASLRKGVDIFTDVAIAAQKKRPDLAFAWLGGVYAEPELVLECVRKAESSGARLLFLGEYESPWPFYAVASAFFLSSREDPYPLVVLEAKSAGLPVLCFNGSGGAPEALEEPCDAIIPPFDIDAAVEALLERLPVPGSPARPLPPAESIPPYAENTARALWNGLQKYLWS